MSATNKKTDDIYNQHPKKLAERVFLRFREIYQKIEHINSKIKTNYWWYPESINYEIEISAWGSWIMSKDLNIIKIIIDILKRREINEYLRYPPFLKQFDSLYGDFLMSQYGSSGVGIKLSFRSNRAPVEKYLLEEFLKGAISIDKGNSYRVTFFDKEKKSAIEKDVSTLDEYLDAFFSHDSLWPVRLFEMQGFPLDDELKQRIASRK